MLTSASAELLKPSSTDPIRYGVAALRRCCTPVPMSSGKPEPLICCIADLLDYWREVASNASCGGEPQGRDGQDHECHSACDEPEYTRTDFADRCGSAGFGAGLVRGSKLSVPDDWSAGTGPTRPTAAAGG